MRIGRPLPISVPVESDESWDSYLTRVAVANCVTMLALGQHAGMVVNGRWPALYGVRLWKSAAVERAAHMLGIEPPQIAAMHLQRFDQVALDLSPLIGTDNWRAVVDTCRSWVFLTGSRYCPACLSADGRWRVTWRLPWITTCLHHEVLLEARCPGCGQLARSGKGEHASHPRLATARPDAVRCNQSRRDARLSVPCPVRLDEAAQQKVAARELTATRRALTMIAADAAVVLGRPHSALSAFGAWRTAACYVKTLKLVPVADEPRDRAAPRRPPRSPRHMLDLQLIAAELLDAPTAEVGADLLESWCEQAKVSPSPALFDDAAASSDALQPAVVALLRRHGRAHSMLNRSLDQLDPQTRLGIVDFDADDVPQIAWPCTLQQVDRPARGPSMTMLQIVTSLILARIAGAQTWRAAGLVLGWTEHDGAQWARYTFAGRDGRLRRSLIQAALTTSTLLTHQPDRHAWASRPATGGPTPRRWASAQSPHCRRNDPNTQWCPCSGAAPNCL